MKLLISLFVITLIILVVYRFAALATNRQIRKRKKLIAIVVAAFLFGFLVFITYRDTQAGDAHCSVTHKVSDAPPQNPQTGMDYYQKGNYEYDTGNCLQAIKDYTRSIQLNPAFPQAFNNRAYTYMRLRDYQKALSDLDQALALNPKYLHALMNRGDIYNYYYAIDKQKAVADYQKVIALGGTRETNVCGHLFLAKHNGWNVGTIIGLPGLMIGQCQ